MHDADDVVLCGGFGLEDISVAEENHSIRVHLEDSVDDVIASGVKN